MNLGGKTPEEARKLLDDPKRGVLGEIALEKGPERFSFDAKEMGGEFDAAGTADQAYALGREGGLLRRLVDRLAAVLGVADVPARAGYRPEVARAEVEELARRLNE